MPRNPDDLMNMQPSELKSLSSGEYRIFCGMKFEALEKSDAKMSKHISKLDKRLWQFLFAILIAMFSTFVMIMLAV
ncbi:unnamed protein product [marine sediment metagenome]|uniref:Uncharacterized protein n=1 Tax=marine sediment metagenome TaxID=412755 RepID=X1TL09_9ZZZZ